MRVLAIDPGERVGWARGIVSPDSLLIEDHGISGLKPFAVKLHEVIADYDAVIYETFRLTPKGARTSIGSDLPTLQLVGMIRCAAWLNPEVKLIAQDPAIKKTADKTAKDEALRLIEAEPGTHDDAHDIDAVRHLSYWFWKQQMKEVQRAK